ncbi:hypothetical protein COCMIDRAFT_108112 [Bipolaris oryzae ATCC 44560]|uniref:Uncharacterized protein n=1 Tax=Bipolaris oryzae ATCC 44560 TaxID=930090 RepID=W6YYU1_COCMI|nr:uncharacterized protein COCMIDRAFT_108112 [Bipolaris oryzae ATCC 44560]EUC40694.1 hypothetical protein COCMIDRAFT_108112 [Bipolaris oryzae ATCC 44560]
MAPLLAWTVLFTSVISTASGAAIKPQRQSINKRSVSNILERKPVVRPRRDGDPTDYSWVKNLVAIGDSFTAGIGSGNHLGSVFHDENSWLCSRYDLSYPMLVYNTIGSSVKDFQFPACSGDRSVQIFEQVEKLKDNIDMVIMTAGGNDLCLAGMIKKCVMLPYEGEETCNAIIDKAQENIDTILKSNLKQILLALNDKMAEDGVVVYNGYSQFFNTENDDCATKQSWAFSRWLPKYWFKTALTLTTARRERFNKLVLAINNAIRDVIYILRDEESIKYQIGFSNWDPWVRDGVKGQMCDPSSSGAYPDNDQPDLQFFKPSTNLATWEHDELRRRQEEIKQMHENGTLPSNKDEIDPSIYDSILWKSPSPGAEVIHKLNKRAPAPPGCPGDNDWFDPTLGLGLPDSFGKLFHPNELGHETIASFALAKGIDLRAKVLGQDSETCAVTDEFKCWQKEGRKGYVTADRMNESIEKFCGKDVNAPDHEVGWRREFTYFQGTLDEHTFVLQLGEDAGDFKKDDCIESFQRIVHSCDGNDPENPLNWKFGGRWRRDDYTYEINVKRDNRPWPMKETYGSCNGDYKFLWSSYSIKGAGFSSWDHGQETILKQTRYCLGEGVTEWGFSYFDQPDENGYEWSASFRTPIWVKARCFANNKVVMASGGFTNGCSGSDA